MRALPAWGSDSRLQVVNVVGWRGAQQPAAAPSRPPLLPGLAVSAKGRTAPPRSLPSPGRPTQTLNFSGVQNLRRLLSPRRPRPAPRRPVARCLGAAGHQRALCLGVSWGERSAAPARVAGGATRAPRQGLGHPAPAQPSAGEAAAGIYGAERRGGAGGGAGSPWTCVWGEPRSRKEEEVGGATVVRSRRRRLGARAGCSAVNDSRETHTRARPPSSRVRDSEPTPAGAGAEPGALALSLLPGSPWSRGPGARGPRLAHRRDPPFSSPFPVHVSIPHSRPGGARGSLMRLRQGRTSPFRAPLLYVLFFLPRAGQRWGPSGARCGGCISLEWRPL